MAIAGAISASVAATLVLEPAAPVTGPLVIAQSDEGVPQNLMHRLQPDEGVPQNLVTA
ncbi:MAG: hypothetical protein GX652_17615 [Burkholderiaceae bacterium]|nr:hypothetical protein [Burkholderiaceae bacterium]